MSLTYMAVQDDPTRLRACTGLDRAEFDRLCGTFALAWEEHRRTYHRAPESRKRALGGGRIGRFGTVEEKLFFLLFYFKTYPLQEVMGTIFAMRQSQVNEWVHRLGDGLHATLGVDAYLPERDPATLEAVLADCASRELLIDGPERPIQRPRDATRPRAAFRGKKRRTRRRTSSS